MTFTTAQYKFVMPTLEPISFFKWNKPRILIDIRPENAFRKGSLEKARSIPFEEYYTVEKFLNQKIITHASEPIHIIDQDGETAKQLSEFVPMIYLEGGYKNFKSWRNRVFETGPQINILGGYTGSGKTRLLNFMNKNGYQVINLEGLALHRGSVFGKFRNEIQPSHEHFQNQLLKIWLNLDNNKPLWIEEKGPFLGQAGIPESLQKRMKNSTLYHLEVPFEERLKYLIKEYRVMDPSDFQKAIRKLEPRMGTSNSHKALHFYDSGQIEKCYKILLNYYDNGYDKRRDKDWKGKVVLINHKHHNLLRTVKQIKSL